jgi:hypothetical protein
MPNNPMRLIRTRRRALNGLAVTRSRCETVPAIDRLVAARLERNLRYAAALAARGPEHLALTVTATWSAAAAAGCFTRGPAIAASARFVCESFARKKLLFARGERERASAVSASEGFVGVHLSLLTLLLPAATTTGVPLPRDSGKRYVFSSNRMAKLRRLRYRLEESLYNAGVDDRRDWRILPQGVAPERPPQRK